VGAERWVVAGLVACLLTAGAVDRCVVVAGLVACLFTAGAVDRCVVVAGLVTCLLTAGAVDRCVVVAGLVTCLPTAGAVDRCVAGARWVAGVLSTAVEVDLRAVTLSPAAVLMFCSDCVKVLLSPVLPEAFAAVRGFRFAAVLAKASPSLL